MIGIIALIFLGPRKIPDIARKAGKFMAEFRSTTQEFKSTWEREVNLEEETKAFDIDVLEEEAVQEKEKVPKLSAPPSENVIARAAGAEAGKIPGVLRLLEGRGVGRLVADLEGVERDRA